MSKPFVAPWRASIARSLYRNKSQAHHRYLQLATCCDNTPSVRTLVFRGFLHEHNSLVLYTDARSHKVKALQAQPVAEICWYFTASREQFRLRGLTHIVGADETDEHLAKERRVRWQQLSLKGQQGFLGPVPGSMLSDAPGAPSDASTTEPPPHFALLLMHPDWAEHLELKPRPQLRQEFVLDEAGWRSFHTAP